jgi:nicotinate-nucleotide adenylyltransferase
MTSRDGRVGLLGGTFDPVHLGHLAAAEAAASALSLDRVFLLPSHLPPHKPAEPRASAFHRFAMVSLAVGARPGLAASDLELCGPVPSYTAVTLRALHRQGLDARWIFFIIGTDAFADIATWHDYPAVLDLAQFVVIARPGYSVDALRARLPHLAPRMRDVGRPVDPAGAAPPGVHFVQADTPDISSSALRARIASGQSVTGFVPPGVEAHIHRHGLYARGGAPWW